MSGTIEIVATGMVSPVGLTAPTSCAAIRAKVSAFQELPYLDNTGQPIIGAAVPGFTPSVVRRDRVLHLLARAIHDCLGNGQIARTERIPLLVGTAEPDRPGCVGGAGADFIADAEAVLQLRFDTHRSLTISTGHVAGFEALRRAQELLEDPRVPACLICGVDSYVNASSLLWLDRTGRLKTPDNSDGVIPGEGAACVLAIRPYQEQADRCTARLLGLGFAHEDASVLTQEPTIGLGLAEAARQALAQAGMGLHDVDFRISDVTGESYGFREQSLLVSRVMRVRRECLPIWHTADSLGDTGAAAGVCQLIVALQAWRRRYAPGKRAIGFTSAVTGDRAVVVIERQVAPASAAVPPRPDTRTTQR